MEKADVWKVSDGANLVQVAMKPEVLVYCNCNLV